MKFFPTRRRSSARRSFASPPPRRSTRWMPSVQGLEERSLLSITIDIDTSHDSSNFFNANAQALATLQAAANTLASSLNDHLLAIAPNLGIGDTWTPSFTDPSNGSTDSIPNLMVPADTIIVFVGGRNLGNGGEAGFGATGAFNASGDENWLNTVAARGKAGALAASPTAYGPWGGSIAFDNASTNWNFSLTTSPTVNQTDFFTVAEHELGHVLGIGTSGAWTTATSTIRGFFVGPATLAAHGGQPVPISQEGQHWADKTQSGGANAVMDPILIDGTRLKFSPLDYAGLSDIGWVVQPPATPTPSTFQFSTTAYSAPIAQGTATITVTRTGGLGETSASVLVSAGNGTALLGKDYSAGPTVLTFGPLDTSKSFTITFLNNPSHAGNPTVNLALSKPSTGDSIGLGSSVLTIVETLSHTAFDFDGDGRADLALFRVSTAQWIVAPSGNGSLNIPSFGATNLFDIPVAADFDGVGHAELAVFRPSTGQWFIAGHAQPVSFGATNYLDIPVPADYDGVGHAELAVFRPSTGQWFIAGHAQPISFGATNFFDIPVPADYDGVGHAELAVFRPSTAQWIIGGHAQPIQFGAGGLFDLPAPADFDGAGRVQLAVFRPSTGQWFIGGHPGAVSFGAQNLFDIPIEAVPASLALYRAAGIIHTQALRIQTSSLSSPSAASLMVAQAPTDNEPPATPGETRSPHRTAWLAALEALNLF